ncbi:MAG: carbohydrate-binding module family 20 domain-containing protein, partial [Candidatus Marinimicrobia bacterium]|nr:carbohydrate-binding module family 20 domain-containing protein [Candidatus Neomarinimicrobiota bacterium]
ADGIYEGTFDVAPGTMEYKYRINGNWDTSESLAANRSYEVLDGDNVIPTVWYSDQEPVASTDVEVLIQVDMTVQILNGNYDTDNGDLIVIRGDHDNFGNWGGSVAMILDPEQTNIYTHLSSFDNVPIGSGYEYKFVILTGGDPDAAIWEGSPNRSFTATGDEVDSDENGYGEILQPVAYFADVTPDDIITQDVTVNWTVDISSAYHALAAGDTLIDAQTGSDDITAWDQVNGVCINGVLSQWWDWGNDLTCIGEWAMTATEDEALYTYSYLYTAGQAKAQQYKYGINSLDNEAGFGENRDFEIDDTNPIYLVPQDCFGSQNTDSTMVFPVDCGPIVTGPTVTLSVDMSFQETLGNFDPDSDFVDVAGTLNDWTGAALTDADADGIWEGTFPVDEGAMEYKFRINANWDTSENLPANRTYTVVAGENVLPTVWYSDQEPVASTNVEVFIQVDMTVQLLNGNFDTDNGDLIVIRGDHDNFGNWGGSVAMILDPEQTNIYTHLSSFDNVPIGSGYEYKFVILTGGDPDAAIWESSPNRAFTATGTEEDSDENGYGEIFMDAVYFADVTPDDIITQNVTVTWTVDITSAYRALAAGDTLIDTQTGADDITAWEQINGICINGVLSQWWDWGNDLTCVGEWSMTQSDTEGYEYTFSYLYTAGQAKAQQYKYGINSLDNEAGFGENRDFEVDDTNPTYVLEDDCFGSQNTDETMPFPQDCGPVSIASLPGIPTSYALSQNYPNPFNPTTSINFALPEANHVVLTIYNALGQEVRTLKTDYLSAGNYSVTWDGLDNAGNMITSGVYIYTMTSGNHNFSKKMLMLK